MIPKRLVSGMEELEIVGWNYPDYHIVNIG